MKNDGNWFEKRYFEKRVPKSSSKAASGLHFWGSGEPKAPCKPQPNGLRRAAERPAPGLQATGSRSKPLETEETEFQAAKGLRDPKSRGATQVGPGHSGYLEG